MVSIFEKVENIVGKGENVGYQHFILLPQGFQKAYFSGSLKLVWKMVYSFNTESNLTINLKKKACTSTGGKREKIGNDYLLFIRPSKTGHIMGSPVASGQAVSSSLKFCGWIDLIKGKYSADDL